jgi:hypothetical protein
LDRDRRSLLIGLDVLVSRDLHLDHRDGERGTHVLVVSDDLVGFVECPQVCGDFLYQFGCVSRIQRHCWSPVFIDY